MTISQETKTSNISDILKSVMKQEDKENEGPVITVLSEKLITNENHMEKEVKPITSPYEKKK